MNAWNGISDTEKRNFVEAASKISDSEPTFFNLESDKNDGGGKFSDMSQEQVISAAKESAHRMM